MKPMKPEDIKKLPIQQPDETLHQHDIKLLELDTRLRSLEQLVNAMHNKYPVYWEEVKD